MRGGELVPLAAQVSVGIPLGVLFGLLSGAVSVQCLRTLHAVRHRVGYVVVLLAQLANTSTLWLVIPFGSKILAGGDPSEVRTSYMFTLAVVWSAVVCVPVIHLISATVDDFKRGAD